MPGSPHVWLREAIEAATDCNAWPVGMTGTDEPPFVIYARENTAREQVLADAFAATPAADAVPPVARFVVAVYADDYVEAWTIAGQITGAIHRFAGTAGGTTIDHCLVLDERDGQPDYLEGRETPTYTVELSVEIRYIA
jgi:hypothetical protein